MNIEIQPNQDAIDFLKNKAPVARKVFDRMLPEVRSRAFAVAGIDDASTLQRVRDRLADLPSGGNWNDIRNDIAADIDLTDDAAQRKAENLLRIHGFQAYAVSRHQAQFDPDNLATYLKYVTCHDDRVRPEHAALDGIILPRSDPFWNTHYPPWDWGCRCLAVEMMAEEVDGIKAYESDLPADRRTVLDDAQRSQINRDANSILVRDGRQYNLDPPTGENAYHFDPGDLTMPLDQIMGRYDPEIGKAFAESMQEAILPAGDVAGAQQTSVYDWLYAPLLKADAETAVASTKHELAVLRDYDMPTLPQNIPGTKTGVSLERELEAARRDGRRITIEHNHLDVADATPAPRDVATLLANPDVIVSLGASTGYAGSITDRRVIRQGDSLSDAGRKSLVNRLRSYQRPDGTLTIPTKKWYAILQQFRDIQGAIRYETEIP